MSCLHEEFGVHASVGRIQRGDDDPTIVRYTAEMTVTCVQCGTAMEFQGLPIGVDTHGPTMSPDGLEARMILMPKGEKLLHEGRITAILRGHDGNA